MVSAATWASALMLAAGLILADPGRAGGLPGDEEVYGFDDAPLAEPMDHPSWFKDSFLDLGADLKEAVGAGKQGLIVYFGQRRCAYCQKLLKVNFGLEGIAEYTRAHFDVVAIDVWGVAEVTDIQGRTLIERDYADQLDTVFTPSLLFYNAEGELALRLRGYYPPYQFRAALEYVADAHYRRESFRDYLARGDNRMVFDAQDLNAETFFASPPYNLDRRVPSERSLAVFFEQGDCHACDVLHGQSLRDSEIYRNFEDIDSAQIDMWSDTPVVTPAGERTTARDWAAQLGLFYAPSILFFDEYGKEILRVDSVVAFNRLRHVLTYIRTKAYLEESFPQWRERQLL